MALRRRWKIVFGILGTLVVVLVTPAMIAPGRHYDPAPYLAEVKRSAELAVAPGDTALSGDLILRHARIVDVNGARGPTSIRIDAGRITAIGNDVAAGPTELDVAGATVMPGLVDAHVHLSLTPGGLTRQDSAETTRALRLHHMRAYLACGVTTIFDPGVETVVMQDVQRSLAAGHPGPRYLAVGTPLAPAGGYLEALWPPGIRTAAEVGPRLDALVKAGAVGVKIAFETGYVRPVWRLYPPEVERAIVEEAGKRKLPLYVHAERADMVRRALAVRPYALVHAPIDATKELAAEIAAAKIPVITTVALFDAHRIVLHPEEADDLRLDRVVPPIELASLRDPRQYRDHLFGMLTEVMPFVPGRYRDLLAWAATTEGGLRKTDEENGKMARSTMQSLRYLKDAGVPLVLGTDSGNWPLFPYYFHGPTTWRELRLLAEAGLSPVDILRAATVNAAEMLGIGNEIGTVEIGKVADLVVVQDDPLVDVAKAMRSLRYTIRSGVARTPEAWMVSAPRP